MYRVSCIRVTGTTLHDLPHEIDVEALKRRHARSSYGHGGITEKDVDSLIATCERLLAREIKFAMDALMFDRLFRAETPKQAVKLAKDYAHKKGINPRDCKFDAVVA